MSIRVDIQVNGHGGGYRYGCPHPLTIYMDIHTNIRADIRVKLCLLRTVRLGVFTISLKLFNISLNEPKQNIILSAREWWKKKYSS